MRRRPPSAQEQHVYSCGRWRTSSYSLFTVNNAGMKGRGKREIPEKTHRPTASSGTIPTCESPHVAPTEYGGRETGDPQENPPTSGIVWCFSQVQKCDPPGVEPGSSYMKGEESNHYTTAAPGVFSDSLQHTSKMAPIGSEYLGYMAQLTERKASEFRIPGLFEIQERRVSVGWYQGGANGRDITHVGKFTTERAGHGSVVVRLLVSRLGEPVRFPVGSLVPRFPHPPPRSFHYGAAPYSPRCTLIGSQDLDVKSRSNVTTPLHLSNVIERVKRFGRLLTARP
ncbi:hypothetical protein PR048_029545 [Dryococelus australis]|uniref:Uncharacterized protein n=1 Tax=Dryococelus australis TaxID=614101 RepID=A0ABQ9GFX2_9NEOP|nr:hypothetical protein PR048_029545 [Dryococelus australis]